MRHIVLAAASGLTLLAAPVNAADFRAPYAAKAPVAMSAPSYNWTGCYIGVHGGGGMMRSDYVDEDRWGGGGLVGGQLGCNYQMNMLVVGIEAEGWWSSMKAAESGGDGSEYRWDDYAKNKWDFAASLRVGMAFDNLLVYGKAGAAFGRFEWGDNYYEFGSLYDYERGSATLPGMLLGIGAEYAFAPNWTAKIEYNYINYAVKEVTFDRVYVGDSVDRHTHNEAAEKQIVKIGLNYKFGGHR